jgi:hypothetical protein
VGLHGHDQTNIYGEEEGKTVCPLSSPCTSACHHVNVAEQPEHDFHFHPIARNLLRHPPSPLPSRYRRAAGARLEEGAAKVLSAPGEFCIHRHAARIV